MLFVSERSWKHHYVTLLLPYTVPLLPGRRAGPLEGPGPGRIGVALVDLGLADRRRPRPSDGRVLLAGTQGHKSPRPTGCSSGRRGRLYIATAWRVRVEGRIAPAELGLGEGPRPPGPASARGPTAAWRRWSAASTSPNRSRTLGQHLNAPRIESTSKDGSSGEAPRVGRRPPSSQPERWPRRARAMKTSREPAPSGPGPPPSPRSALEGRELMTGGVGDTFAIMPATITKARRPCRGLLHPRPQAVHRPRQQALRPGHRRRRQPELGSSANPRSCRSPRPTGQTLRRGPRRSTSRSPGPAPRATSIDSSAGLVTIPGLPAKTAKSFTYKVNVSAIGKTSGAILVGFYLPGDAQGTGTVNQADINAIPYGLNTDGQRHHRQVLLRRRRQPQRPDRPGRPQHRPEEPRDRHDRLAGDLGQPRPQHRLRRRQPGHQRLHRPHHRRRHPGRLRDLLRGQHRPRHRHRQRHGKLQHQPQADHGRQHLQRRRHRSRLRARRSPARSTSITYNARARRHRQDRATSPPPRRRGPPPPPPPRPRRRPRRPRPRPRVGGHYTTCSTTATAPPRHQLDRPFAGSRVRRPPTTTGHD